jgi:hypothetical protein
MNRAWIVPVLSALAGGLVAYGVARQTVCGRFAPRTDRLEDTSFLSKELGLSEEQTTDIRRLHAALAAQVDGSCARHCAARVRLARALAADSNGTEQADVALAEMCRAYEQSERAALERIRQVRAVLTEEQRRRFDAMISRCTCERKKP